jgi:Cu-Zn family superoxide dismutase
MNRFSTGRVSTSVAFAIALSVAGMSGAMARQAPPVPPGGTTSPAGQGQVGGATAPNAPPAGQGRAGAAPGAPGGGGRGGGITVTGMPRQKAHADIAGTGITGTADFNEYPMGNGMILEIILSVQGLPAGLHGVHVHAVGKCDGPDFTSAGGHFDPGPAGSGDPDTNHPYHSGDLPNLNANATTGSMTAFTTRFGLSGPLSILGPEGTAIVIHANPDLITAGTTGSGVAGGPRLACGVIKKSPASP